MIPALVAFAGGIGGLWSLTLGQDPANALPHWSPVSGWALGLGSLALAAVLAWIGLARRRCPDCGSSQMLDAMEEEAASATERLAGQKAAVEEARAETRSLLDKAMVDSLSAREMELRATLEHELRIRLTRELTRELEPHIEHDLRGRIEKELRVSLGNELRLQAEHEQRSAPAAKPFSSPVTLGPVTPPLTSVGRVFTSPSSPAVVAGAHPARVAGPTAAAKNLTPSPARSFSAPHPKVETAPLSLLSSPGKAPGSSGPRNAGP